MESKSIFLMRTDPSLLKTEVTEEEQEYRETQYPDEKKVLKEKIKCTSCDRNIKEKILSNLTVWIHPALEVVVCSDCNEFYSDGDFSADEDGSDKYCRWCGQGGSLYCCSQCSVAICAKCIKRNFRKSYIDELENDDWKCFICETKPIWSHRALCNAIKKYVTSKKKNKRNRIVDSDTEDEDQPTRKSKRKKKDDVSSDDIEENVFVEKNKRSPDMRQEESASSLEIDQSKNVKSDEKDILYHIAVDTLNDYEKLTKIMIKNKENTYKKYLKDDQFMKNADWKLILMEKIFDLIHNSEESLARIKSSFRRNCNNNDITSSNNKEENEQQNSSDEQSVKENDLTDKDDESVDKEEEGNSKLGSEDPNISVIETETKSDIEEELINEKEDESIIGSEDSTVMIETETKSNSENELNDAETSMMVNTSGETLYGKIDTDEKKTEQTEKNAGCITDQETLNIERNENSSEQISNNDNFTLEITDSAMKSDCENELDETNNESPVLSQNNKDKIAKAALLECSSDSNNSSSESENTPKSSESNISGVDVLKSENEKTNSRKKQKKKERVKGEEEVKQEEKMDVENKINKEINRLTNLNNLNRSTCSAINNENNTSGDSENENKTKKIRKMSLKKQNQKKSLEEYLSNGSDADKNDELDDSFSEFSSYMENKERPFSLNKNEMSKKMLLNSSDTDGNELNSNDDDLLFDSKTEKDKEKNSNFKSDEKLLPKENTKKDQPKWKNDKLLKTKISESDSDDERIIRRVHRRQKKPGENNSNSSDSEDVFRPKTSSLWHKKKKKLTSSGSDSNHGNSSSSSVKIISGSDFDNKKIKRRKRIKILNVSENSESEDDNKSTQGSASKGRKNIRKVMEDTDLTEQTRKTAKEEELRKKRISERQALFNESFKIPDSSEETLSKLVLDFDPETKEELVSVDPDLIKKLKPHQAKGVKFMWDSCFESLKQIKKGNGGGCILAHCMGLGKTLQVITLIHTVFKYEEINVKTVLVICPLTTVLNWSAEFEMWLSYVKDGYDINIFHLTEYRNNIMRADLLNNWSENGGVMILGYEMFRNLTNNTKIKKKSQDKIHKALLDPGPDLVICDEGHILKNELSAISRATMKIKTLRRIVLTGTPLQNNLKEYHCMVQFVKPSLLGDRKEFLNRFANPITNGQYIDSTKEDVRLMKRRAHVLHKMLDGIVQRFDYNVLTPFLPPKHEFVISVALSDLQAKLYEHYIHNFSRLARPFVSSLFKDYQMMRSIWTHPYIIHFGAKRTKKNMKVESDTDSLKDFVVSGSENDDSSSSHNSAKSDGSFISISSDKNDNEKNNMLTKSKKKGLNNGVEEPRSGSEPEQDDSNWWNEFVTDNDIENYQQGPKLVLLFAILRECETIGDKMLIFSQSILSLDMIEYFLKKYDEFSQNVNLNNSPTADYLGKWERNVDYFRLDGRTPNELRIKYCKAFNRPSNTRARLFLISTKAGGLGINLVAANRVIIFDASWNPSHDVQSIFRVYRFGQMKPCYVYRLLAQGTMEEKIYERQVTKLSISCRVVDEQQIDRHFSHNEVEELYTFNRKTPSEDEIPKLPKDRLMAELLKQHKDIILSYHEHDSLLENVIDEELTEEERKHAWEEYENEKNRTVMPNPNLLLNLNNPQLLQTNPANVAAFVEMQISDDAILSSLRKEYLAQNDEALKPMIPVVRKKLINFYENMRKNNIAKNASTENNLNTFANQKELFEQAQIKKAAYLHQLLHQTQNNKVSQEPTDSGFDSHWQSDFSTPKKAENSPSSKSNSFSTYVSPVKNLFPQTPDKTPIKNLNSPSPNRYMQNSRLESVAKEQDPLKTPATWAFNWKNSGFKISLLEKVLKSNCQWTANYETIGNHVLMHLPFCVRTDTLKRKLADYLQYVQFYYVVPEIDPTESLDVFIKSINFSDLNNSKS